MPTDIEWTHIPGFKGETWNPVTGCTKISPGCANCYAETFLMRFHRSGPFLPGNVIQRHDDRLGIPFRWKGPRAVFVNSVSDTFHEDVPDSFLVKMYAVMALTPRHIYQVLTKRPDRAPGLRNLGWLWGEVVEHEAVGWVWGEVIKTEADQIRRLNPGLNLPEYDGTWPLPNVWLGTSAENQYWANDRVPKLLQCPAVVHFVSCEPLLSYIDLYALRQPSGVIYDGLEGWLNTGSRSRTKGLDQVIVGGESGNSKKIRPMHTEWARHLRDQTKMSNKAFFFKQWGKYRPMSDEEIRATPWKARYVSLDPHEREIRRMLEETDVAMIKGSKGGNGHVLDGEEWQEFPTIHERKAS